MLRCNRFLQIVLNASNDLWRSNELRPYKHISSNTLKVVLKIYNRLQPRPELPRICPPSTEFSSEALWVRVLTISIAITYLKKAHREGFKSLKWSTQSSYCRKCWRTNSQIVLSSFRPTRFRRGKTARIATPTSPMGNSSRTRTTRTSSSLPMDHRYLRWKVASWMIIWNSRFKTWQKKK